MKEAIIMKVKYCKFNMDTDTFSCLWGDLLPVCCYSSMDSSLLAAMLRGTSGFLIRLMVLTGGR